MKKEKKKDVHFIGEVVVYDELFQKFCELVVGLPGNAVIKLNYFLDISNKL